MQSFQDEVRSSKSAVSAESLTTCKHYPVQPSMDSIQQTTEGKETGHIGGGKKATNPAHFHPARKSVVLGQGVDLGGRRLIKKNKRSP